MAFSEVSGGNENIITGWDAGNFVFREKVPGNGASVQFGYASYGMDLKLFGAGADDYWMWDESSSKVLHYRYTAEASPGRTHYIYARGSAMTAGNNLQAMQINSRATTTTTIAGGTDALEAKAGLASDSDTGTMASARGVIGDVDAKKGVLTSAQAVMGILNISAGGTITTGAGVTAYMNNSGTLTTGYAFKVDAVAGYGWTYGLYMGNTIATTGIYIGNTTTAINIAGTATTGVTVAACVNAFVVSAACTGTDGWALRVGTSGVPLATTVAASAVAVYNTQSATTGTQRLVVFDQVLTGAITTLSTTAFRAHTQLSANAITGAAYVYGGQHKFSLGAGTINHADSRVCASLVQMDISTGTYTAGQLSALWVDAGASSAMVNNGGQFNMVRITNTTACVPNAVIYLYSEGSYLLDMGAPEGNADWFASTAAGGATRKYALKVKCPDESTGYISVYTD